MQRSAKLAANALRQALAKHDKLYPHGDWKSANDEIEAARNECDAIIKAAGKWPDRQFIGNDMCLKIITDMAASDDGR